MRNRGEEKNLNPSGSTSVSTALAREAVPGVKRLVFLIEGISADW